MGKYFTKKNISTTYDESWALGMALNKYNPKLDSTSPEIETFLAEVHEAGKQQAVGFFNDAKERDTLVPNEAKTYICSLYKLDESAARRLIYSYSNARPNSNYNSEIRDARFALVDIAMSGVEDRINAAAKGFSESVYDSITRAYKSEVYQILSEMEDMVFADNYWFTLKNEVDHYLKEKMCEK